MERTHTQSRLVYCVLGLLSASTLAHAATISLKAVALNGVPVEPTSSLSASPGDTIETEIFFSGWAEDRFFCSWPDYEACSTDADCWFGSCEEILDEFRVRIYQVEIDGRGLTSGSSGRLTPLGRDAPVHGIWCESAPDCPGDFPVCDRFSGCVGVNHSPEDGAFVDDTRSDWMHAGFCPCIVAMDTSSLDYRFGSAAFSDNGPTDDGREFYAGTLILVASDMGDEEGEACGTFTISFDANYGYYDTFLTDPDFRQIVPDVEPLTIDFVCEPPVGACCKRWSCEDLTEGDCLENGGVWHRGTLCRHPEQACGIRLPKPPRRRAAE